ncbi:hypothetical protein [Cyclobacterium plantarum]|uniref:Uncharacterized protein n=1 Tax=Cyclobacterium plantarum TaxID=2716263 RepID=A0ABX0H1V0_9BACT|nr:hypothetical protein [Cyclobacterium plantarum]NHE55584.1 hypothetical protein [Cyclobacterium plantarum]
MEDKKNNLDDKIRQTLSGHQETPDDWVWEKISARLEKKRKPMLIFWKGWAAAAVLILGFSWFLLQLPIPEVNKPISLDSNDKNENDKTVFSPEEKNDLTDLAEVTEPEVKVEKEEQQQKPANGQLSNQKETIKSQSSNKPVENTSPSRKQEVALEASPDILPEWKEIIPVPDIDLALEDTPSGPDPGAVAGEEAYTVRIVSRGYALQPEKEKIVDGLENKIEGFFSKVDQGFGDLQDAKNNLFASLGTKREKKENR